jgi:hypothetical protein
MTLKSKRIPSIFNDESTVLLLHITFLRVLVVFYLRVTCICVAENFNDPVLSSLKMEGIFLVRAVHASHSNLPHTNTMRVRPQFECRSVARTVSSPLTVAQMLGFGGVVRCEIKNSR